MSILHFIVRSLRYDFWMQFTVFLGVVIASAVLCGALLIGDSMQGSLRNLTLDRLGPVDYVLTGTHWFNESLAKEISAKGKDWEKNIVTLPVILVSGGAGFEEQTAGIDLIGCADSIWDFFPQPDSLDNKRLAKPSAWDRGGVVINQSLADLLELSQKENGGVGTTISIWVSRVEKIPADSALGRREETVFRKRLRVLAVLPNSGLGRFSLRPNQQAEPLALIPLNVLQDRSYLDCPEEVNSIFISASHKTLSEISSLVQPTLTDLGMIVDSYPDPGSSAHSSTGQIHIKSSNMLFSRQQDKEIKDILPNAQPVLVYLAESLKSHNSETPYSLVAAIDSITISGEKIPIAQDEIVLNDWTAKDLGVQVGDTVELTYFEPESVYGRIITQTAIFRVSRIVPMQGIANNPKLIPDWEGISDAKSLANWNPPFPFDAKKIRVKDETYWEEHRTTPKAFLSLETGRKLWGSRFGETTTFVMERLENAKRPDSLNQEKVRSGEDSSLNDIETVRSELLKHLNPATFGLTVQPVKQLGLSASKGTTPFNALFLAFSFFIIGAAFMLLAMLFRLALERRGVQLGTLLALGFSRKRLLQILLIEGGLSSLCAALIGVPLGIVYARLMIEGLQSLWIDAIVVPFLKLHISFPSLLIGFFSATILSVLVIYTTLRRFNRLSARELISGGAEQQSLHPKQGKLVFCLVLLTCSILLLILLIAGFISSDQMVKAGLFFGTGTIALILLLFLFYRWLIGMSDSGPGDLRIGSLFHFSVSNAGRNPGRSVLCVGLLSVTAFLVLAVGAFRLDSNSEKGSGGFSLITETRLPVYFDFNNEEGREKLRLSQEDSDFFEKQKIKISAFRVRPGDNAGCLNLYQPKNPRILGVKSEFAQHDKFQFGQAALPSENPWLLLERPTTQDSDGIVRVPIILDANTAMYSLHLYKGVGETFEFEDDRGTPIRGEVVALLANSLFQGEILMGEKNMLQLFPNINGYSFFLIDLPHHPTEKAKPFFQGAGSTTALTAESHDILGTTRKIIQEGLGDFGLTIETTQERLSRLYAVQNTYLATFSSLGGFGLFLGTFGIGIVQWRNVLQRRKELALFRALGFRSAQIIRLVLTENLFLLVLGTLFGAFTAILALIPQVTGATGMSGIALLEQFAFICLGMLIVGILANLMTIRALLRIPLARSLANE